MKLADYYVGAKMDDIPAWSHHTEMPHPPRQFQYTALYRALRHIRYKDLSQAGTGKTVPALALLLARASQGNKCIYVTQPGLVAQAVDALAEWFPGHPFKVSHFKGNPTQRQKLVDQWDAEGWPDLLFMSYALFIGWTPRIDRRGREIEKARKPSDIEKIGWQTYLAKGYNMLAVDEAKVAKNTTSRIYKAIAGFVGPFDYRSNGLLLMEGTPVENVPYDAYGLISLVNPLRYGTEKAFQAMHVEYSTWNDRPQIAGYKELDYLGESLMQSGHRYLKREIMDLPPVTVVNIPVELEPTHMRLYRKVVDEQMLELDDGVMLDFTQSQRLYQATQRMLVGPELVTTVEVAHNALLDTLDDLLTTIGEGKKVMVGCWYRESIAKLMKRYERFNPTFVNGESDTVTNKKKFIEDSSCRLVFTNYRSGGIGIDGFQKVCSYAVMLELPTVPGHYEQWLARLDRGGQTEPVTCYLLYPTRTIAVTLKRNLIKKEGTVEQVVKDKKQLLSELIGE